MAEGSQPGAALSDFAAVWDSQGTPDDYATALAGRLSKIPAGDGRAKFATVIMQVLFEACAVGGEPSPVPIEYLDRAVSLGLLPVNEFLVVLLPMLASDRTPCARALLPLMHRHAAFVTAGEHAPQLTLDIVIVLVKLLIQAAAEARTACGGTPATGAGGAGPVVGLLAEGTAATSLATLTALIGRDRMKSRALMMLARQFSARWAEFIEVFKDMRVQVHGLVLAAAAAEGKQAVATQRVLSDALGALGDFYVECWIPVPSGGGPGAAAAGQPPVLLEAVGQTYSNEEIFRANAIVVVLLLHEIIGQSAAAADESAAVTAAGRRLAAWQRFTGLQTTDLLSTLCKVGLHDHGHGHAPPPPGRQDPKPPRHVTT